MPWYKQGLVSVAQNSNAVIGTGTAFLANSRVGDAFRGPDGAWYEVINIASDTAMAIAPNYQGATNAAGVYALAPMQGYQKGLGDQVRDWVNTYGPKMAALGSSANYEVLPVAHGGTGGNTPALARDGLELVKMTSKTDMVEGHLVTVNDFGLGAPIGLASQDLNSLQTFGFYYVTGATNAPYQNGWLLVQPISSGYCAQSFISEVDGKRYTRTKRTTWDAWSPTAKGGANSDITSLAGLTTPLSAGQGGTGVTTTAGLLAALVGAGAYAKSNAVGTVSQTGGVPTGSLMEYVTNSNGEAWKFANGLLVCSRYFSNPIAFTIGPGVSATSGAFSLPVTAVGTGVKLYNGYATDAGVNIVGSSWIDSFGGLGWKFQVTNLSASVTVTQLIAIQMFYIGRWF